MFRKGQCSPSLDKKKGSCLDRELLEKVAKVVSNLEKCGKIDCSVKSDQKLHKQIAKEIQKISDCDNEACWQTITEIMNKLTRDEKDDFKFSFKPFMPEGWKKEPNKWLNTLDIDNVLEQYEDAHQTFKYFGATPIDFDKEKKDGTCEVNDLCSINIKQLLDDDYESCGAVFNTDDSDGGGEHWFSVYVDLKGVNIKNKPGIYYFDAVGTSAPDEIKELVDELVNQSKTLVDKKNPKMLKEFQVLYNDVQHQHGNTECGIYSIHFLTEMLKGKKFKNYIKERKSDKQMEKFRKIFFIEQ
jgi:hypothetical protein